MTPPLSSPQPTSRPPRRAAERFGSALRAGVAFWPVKLVLLGLAAWGAASLWSWVTTESVAEQNAGDTSSPIQIEGLNSFVVRHNGQKYWEIAADSVKVVDGGDAWVARNVTRGILYRDTKPWITMKAARVRLSNLSRNLDAVGGVTAHGPDGFSFSTAQARWLDSKKLVEIPGAAKATLRQMHFSAPRLFYYWERGELGCPDRVEVRVKGAVLSGSKLEADTKKARVKLGERVELRFVPGVAQLPRPFTDRSPVAPASTATATPAAFRWGERPALMPHLRLLSVPLACALAATPALILAQAPAQAAPAPAVAPVVQGDVVIRGGAASYTDPDGIAVLTGGVTVVQTGNEFRLSAQRVVSSVVKNQATATGDLKVETRNSTIRGGQLFGDFGKKLLSISGNVVISAYDKGNGMNGFRSKTARKPVRIACDRLDWNYATRQATLVGNLRIVQDNNSGTCDKIVYDENNNKVHLMGNVRFGNSQRQQFVGDSIVIFIDKGLVQAPQGVVIRSGVDAPATTPARPAPAIVFPGATNPAAPAANGLPAPPPPIESLVPKSTPLVRPRPSLAPPAAPAPKDKDDAKPTDAKPTATPDATAKANAT